MSPYSVMSVVICGRGHHTREIQGNSCAISLKSNNIFYSFYDLLRKHAYHDKGQVHKYIIHIHFLLERQ